MNMSTSPSSPIDYHSHVRSDVLPYVPALGGTLLDVGGGAGATALRARELGLAQRVGVVDRFEAGSQLDFARSGDIDDPLLLSELGSAEGPFSIILCLDVLEHLVDPWRVVRQLHEMLAPEGVIVASIPNVRHHSVLVPLLAKGSWELQDDGILDRTHLRFFTRRSAVALMTSSGLKLDLVRPLWDGGTGTKLFGWIPLHTISDFAVMQYLVRVRR